MDGRGRGRSTRARQPTTRTTQSQTEAQVNAPLPPHAWLWGESKLSDVTLVLKSPEEEAPTAASPVPADLSSPAAHPHETVDEVERPSKRVCRPICFCTHSPSEAHTTITSSVVTQPAVEQAAATSDIAQVTSLSGCRIPTPGATHRLHAVVLSSASGYFRKLFTTSLGGWCMECKVATQTLEGRELEAAEHVLRFIYTLELPTDAFLLADGSLLLWMIKVADRWDVSSCMKACKEALFARTDSCFPINILFLLPPTFCLSPSIDELLTEAKVRLLNIFGNAPAVLRSKSKLQRLQRLPGSAMLALLSSDALTTDAEASVLLLLRSWYEFNQLECSKEQLFTLKKAVRYSWLARAYICNMLPLMPGFGVTLEQASELWMKSESRGMYEEDLEHEYIPRACPKSWFLPERQPPPHSRPNRTMKLQLKVPQADLLLHVAAVAKMRDGGAPPATLSSEPVYGFGYDWVLELESACIQDPLTVQLRVVKPFSGIAGCLIAECSVKLLCPHEKSDEEATQKVVVTEAGLMWSNVCSNTDEVLGGDGSLGPWAKLIIDGFLCFDAEVATYRKS